MSQWHVKAEGSDGGGGMPKDFFKAACKSLTPNTYMLVAQTWPEMAVLLDASRRLTPAGEVPPSWL